MRIGNYPIIFFLILTILLASALTTPVLAQDDIDFYRGPDIRHSVRYDVEGLISIDRTLGHLCTTGAEKKQTITGYGQLTKLEDVRIVQNLISNQDQITWSVPADAVRGLTVTTTIDLCARPMSTAAANYIAIPGYSASDIVYLEQLGTAFLKSLQKSIDSDYFILRGDIVNPYHPLVVDGKLAVNPMTEQIWGTRISTLPGHEGFYEVDFRAAYGPGPHEVGGVILDSGLTVFYDPEYMWWFDDTKEDGYDSGRFYVGNYFHIDQHAYTSSGTMQRLISMSSPFYNTLMYDNVKVTGQAEIKEAFSMENLDAGPDARTLLWHDLF